MTCLNAKQQLIFDKYCNGENIFITGPGGTGKTYLIKEIVKHATATLQRARILKIKPK